MPGSGAVMIFAPQRATCHQTWCQTTGARRLELDVGVIGCYPRVSSPPVAPATVFLR